jgi:branched-chain amino acid transport system substrate-binding protein
MRSRLCAMSGLVGLVLALPGAVPLAAMAAEPYDISVILSLTGNGAFLGQAEQRSLRILEKLVNDEGGLQDRSIRFAFFDDQTSPQVAIQLANQIVASQPAAIIGPGLVATCNAVAPLMKDGPVMYCLSPGIHPANGGRIFTATVATRDGGQALVRYSRTRGWKRLAFIFSTDATGKEAEEDFEALLKLPENQDVSIVALEHFTPGSVSAAAQLENVKAAQPDVFFAWSTGGPIAVLLRAIVQTGLQVPVVTTNGNQTYEQMAQYVDFLPKDLYLPSSVWPAYEQGRKIDPAVDEAQRRFFTAFKTAGVAPDGPATLPWDPAMIVIDGLRRLGPQATASQLRDYLGDLADYPGIHGRYDFKRTPQRGLDVGDAVVTRWSAAEHRWTIVSQPTGFPATR